MDLNSLEASPQEWSDERLRLAEARADTVLVETGFGSYVGRLESDEAWSAFNKALQAAKGPKDKGTRAARARACLLLISQIRAAMVQRDLHAVFRHALALGALDHDLLTHAEYDAVVVPRQRELGLKATARSKRAQHKELLAEWSAEADRYLADHSGASGVAVAKHVADVCEAKVETVRRALREKGRPLGRR